MASKLLKAAAKKAKDAAIEAAKAKKAKELKANQKKPINELMSKAPAAQAESAWVQQARHVLLLENVLKHWLVQNVSTKLL